MPLFNRPRPALALFLALFTARSGFLVLTPVLPDAKGHASDSASPSLAPA